MYNITHNHSLTKNTKYPHIDRIPITPVSGDRASILMILVGRFQQNHSYNLEIIQTIERDLHDAGCTSLGDGECASLLAGIPHCNVGRPCTECRASISCVRKSRGKENTCPLLFDYSIPHTIPSGMWRHFIHGKILSPLARSLPIDPSILIGNPNKLELPDHLQTLF
jgi:hypothetical protein